MLKYEGKFKVGQVIRSYDFAPHPKRPPCYVEGEVLIERCLSPVGQAWCYLIEATVYVWDGQPDAIMPGQERVYVAHELAMHDYDGRVSLVNSTKGISCL